MSYHEDVQLPQRVKRIIEERAEAVGFSVLKRAATAMSEAYRDGRVARLADEERAAAYLVTRMPATYAAARMVLGEVHARLAGRPVTSVLDVGAGTGAATLAAQEYFPDAAITMVERDSAFAAAAHEWVSARVVTELPPHLQTYDLVIAGYSLGEMGESVAKRLWQAAATALVIIEPGTPKSFSLVRRVRSGLLAGGARMIAPCPMESECPMVDPDWCHFAARVERSSMHRRIKGGDLGYEDEKFSYIAVAREPVALAAERVIRHPRHQPGLVTIETCTAAGLQCRRVMKRDREAFRAARKASWGETWGTLS